MKQNLFMIPIVVIAVSCSSPAEKLAEFKLSNPNCEIILENLEPAEKAGAIYNDSGYIYYHSLSGRSNDILIKYFDTEYQAFYKQINDIDSCPAFLLAAFGRMDDTHVWKLIFNRQFSYAEVAQGILCSDPEDSYISVADASGSRYVSNMYSGEFEYVPTINEFLTTNKISPKYILLTIEDETRNLLFYEDGGLFHNNFYCYNANSGKMINYGDYNNSPIESMDHSQVIYSNYIDKTYYLKSIDTRTMQCRTIAEGAKIKHHVYYYEVVKFDRRSEYYDLNGVQVSGPIDMYDVVIDGYYDHGEGLKSAVKSFVGSAASFVGGTANYSDDNNEAFSSTAATGTLGNFEYLTANNSRGFSICYPSFLNCRFLSENGDGVIMEYDDNNYIKVTGYWNLSDESISTLYNEELKSPMGDITYKIQKNNWFVVSGYLPDGRIFYKKTAITSEEAVASAEMIFEQRNRDYFEPTIKKVFNNFPIE